MSDSDSLAEAAWRQWLRKHPNIEDDEHAAFMDGFKAAMGQRESEVETLIEALDRAAWSVPENTSIGEFLMPYRRLPRRKVT